MTPSSDDRAPDGPDGAVEDKERALCRALQDLGSVVVAFSGGVDSAYLAAAAR